MNEIVTIGNLSVGGLLAIMVIREFVKWTKDTKKEDNSSYITRTEHEKAFEVFQRKDNCTEIVKRMDSRFTSIDNKLEGIERLIKNGNK